ncbi:MAG: hypothetical protein IK082_07460 [Oscillospiraceae bacterium]|nr:hypothetical protein [Oscillospiraceae bacterium]
MKRTRLTRYVGLEAKTASELGELLTQKCEELKGYRPEIVWNLGNGNSAFLVYEEHLEEPEDLRDEYELRGEAYTCEACPFRTPITDGRARHRWTCSERRGGTDIDCPACLHFYEELEKGEIFK